MMNLAALVAGFQQGGGTGARRGARKYEPMIASLNTALAERVLRTSLKRMAELSAGVDPGIEWCGRVKTHRSASRKRLRNGPGAHEILDVIGVRAVTVHVSDCYRLIRLIHSEFPVLENEFDDYIAAPKLNGYQSLHTTVSSPCGFPIEVQVRTRAMHAHAEGGAASHVRYKERQALEISRA